METFAQTRIHEKLASEYEPFKTTFVKKNNRSNYLYYL
jgi:hypothetical protein